MERAAGTVTHLLTRWKAGDASALDELIPLLYGELRRLARRHLRGERTGHTLQTTALVHEAYVHLVDTEIPWQDRAHFLATAARQMRRILVDHARARRSAKRGGSFVLVPLQEDATPSGETPTAILDLDEALTRLADHDSRKARVVELHFFAGMTYEEIAEVLGVSTATVRLDVRIAKAWLRSELSGGVETGR